MSGDASGDGEAYFQVEGTVDSNELHTVSFPSSELSSSGGLPATTDIPQSNEIPQSSENRESGDLLTVMPQNAPPRSFSETDSSARDTSSSGVVFNSFLDSTISTGGQAGLLSGHIGGSPSVVPTAFSPTTSQPMAPPARGAQTGIPHAMVYGGGGIDMQASSVSGPGQRIVAPHGMMPMFAREQLPHMDEGAAMQPDTSHMPSPGYPPFTHFLPPGAAMGGYPFPGGPQGFPSSMPPAAMVPAMAAQQQQMQQFGVPGMSAGFHHPSAGPFGNMGMPGAGMFPGMAPLRHAAAMQMAAAQGSPFFPGFMNPYHNWLMMEAISLDATRDLLEKAVTAEMEKPVDPALLENPPVLSDVSSLVVAGSPTDGSADTEFDHAVVSGLREAVQQTIREAVTKTVYEDRLKRTTGSEPTEQIQMAARVWEEARALLIAQLDTLREGQASVAVTVGQRYRLNAAARLLYSIISSQTLSAAKMKAARGSRKRGRPPKSDAQQGLLASGSSDTKAASVGKKTAKARAKTAAADNGTGILMGPDAGVEEGADTADADLGEDETAVPGRIRIQLNTGAAKARSRKRSRKPGGAEGDEADVDGAATVKPKKRARPKAAPRASVDDGTVKRRVTTKRQKTLAAVAEMAEYDDADHMDEEYLLLTSGALRSTRRQLSSSRSLEVLPEVEGVEPRISHAKEPASSAAAAAAKKKSSIRRTLTSEEAEWLDALLPLPVPIDSLCWRSDGRPSKLSERDISNLLECYDFLSLARPVLTLETVKVHLAPSKIAATAVQRLENEALTGDPLLWDPADLGAIQIANLSNIGDVPLSDEAAAEACEEQMGSGGERSEAPPSLLLHGGEARSHALGLNSFADFVSLIAADDVEDENRGSDREDRDGGGAAKDWMGEFGGNSADTTGVHRIHCALIRLLIVDRQQRTIVSSRGGVQSFTAGGMKIDRPVIPLVKSEKSVGGTSMEEASADDGAEKDDLVSPVDGDIPGDESTAPATGDHGNTAAETKKVAAVTLSDAAASGSMTTFHRLPLTPLTWPHYACEHLQAACEELGELIAAPQKIRRGATSWEAEELSVEIRRYRSLADAISQKGFERLTAKERVQILKFLVIQTSRTQIFRSFVECLLEKFSFYEKQGYADRRMATKVCEGQRRTVFKALQEIFDELPVLEKYRLLSITPPPPILANSEPGENADASYCEEEPLLFCLETVGANGMTNSTLGPKLEAYASILEEQEHYLQKVHDVERRQRYLTLVANPRKQPLGFDRESNIYWQMRGTQPMVQVDRSFLSTFAQFVGDCNLGIPAATSRFDLPFDFPPEFPRMADVPRSVQMPLKKMELVQALGIHPTSRYFKDGVDTGVDGKTMARKLLSFPLIIDMNNHEQITRMQELVRWQRSGLHFVVHSLDALYPTTPMVGRPKVWSAVAALAGREDLLDLFNRHQMHLMRREEEKKMKTKLSATPATSLTSWLDMADPEAGESGAGDGKTPLEDMGASEMISEPPPSPQGDDTVSAPFRSPWLSREEVVAASIGGGKQGRTERAARRLGGSVLSQGIQLHGEHGGEEDGLEDAASATQTDDGDSQQTPEDIMVPASHMELTTSISASDEQTTTGQDNSSVDFPHLNGSDEASQMHMVAREVYQEVPAGLATSCPPSTPPNRQPMDTPYTAATSSRGVTPTPGTSGLSRRQIAAKRREEARERNRTRLERNAALLSDLTKETLQAAYLFIYPAETILEVANALSKNISEEVTLATNLHEMVATYASECSCRLEQLKRAAQAEKSEGKTSNVKAEDMESGVPKLKLPLTITKAEEDGDDSRQNGLFSRNFEAEMAEASPTGHESTTGSVADADFAVTGTQSDGEAQSPVAAKSKGTSRTKKKAKAKAKPKVKSSTSARSAKSAVGSSHEPDADDSQLVTEEPSTTEACVPSSDSIGDMQVCSSEEPETVSEFLSHHCRPDGLPVDLFRASTPRSTSFSIRQWKCRVRLFSTEPDGLSILLGGLNWLTPGGQTLTERLEDRPPAAERRSTTKTRRTCRVVDEDSEDEAEKPSPTKATGDATNAIDLYPKEIGLGYLVSELRWALFPHSYGPSKFHPIYRLDSSFERLRHDILLLGFHISIRTELAQKWLAIFPKWIACLLSVTTIRTYLSVVDDLQDNTIGLQLKLLGLDYPGEEEKVGAYWLDMSKRTTEDPLYYIREADSVQNVDNGSVKGNVSQTASMVAPHQDETAESVVSEGDELPQETPRTGDEVPCEEPVSADHSSWSGCVQSSSAIPVESFVSIEAPTGPSETASTEMEEASHEHLREEMASFDRDEHFTPVSATATARSVVDDACSDVAAAMKPAPEATYHTVTLLPSVSNLPKGTPHPKQLSGYRQRLLRKASTDLNDIFVTPSPHGLSRLVDTNKRFASLPGLWNDAMEPALESESELQSITCTEKQQALLEELMRLQGYSTKLPILRAHPGLVELLIILMMFADVRPAKLPLIEEMCRRRPHMVGRSREAVEEAYRSTSTTTHAAESNVERTCANCDKKWMVMAEETLVNAEMRTRVLELVGEHETSQESLPLLEEPDEPAKKRRGRRRAVEIPVRTIGGQTVDGCVQDWYKMPDITELDSITNTNQLAVYVYQLDNAALLGLRELPFESAHTSWLAPASSMSGEQLIASDSMQEEERSKVSTTDQTSTSSQVPERIPRKPAGNVSGNEPRLRSSRSAKGTPSSATAVSRRSARHRQS